MHPIPDPSSGPLVSVIMPVYNAAAYVGEAIGSILNQTYRNLEVLVFNDGSKDNSADVIRAIQMQDPRLKFFDSAENFGYVVHLNRGIELAQGKYIARMDADDSALPERLAKQVYFLETHPEVGVCGTWYDIVGRSDIIERTAVTDADIRLALLANSALAHPTVTMRADVLRKHGIKYNTHFLPAEDFYMWYTLSKYTQLSNIPEVLLHYRHHEGQISNYKSNRQRDRADQIRAIQLEEYGFELTADELDIYYKLMDNYLRPLNAADYGQMKPLMDKLVEQNRRLKAFPTYRFEEFIHQIWQTAVYNVKEYSPALLRSLFGTRARVANDYLGLNSNLRTVIKSLLYWKIRI
jgi:glycosyltransferase involved in cell wall biosynthesis